MSNLPINNARGTNNEQIGVSEGSSNIKNNDGRLAATAPNKLFTKNSSTRRTSVRLNETRIIPAANGFVEKSEKSLSGINEYVSQLVEKFNNWTLQAEEIDRQALEVLQKEVLDICNSVPDGELYSVNDLASRPILASQSKTNEVYRQLVYNAEMTLRKLNALLEEKIFTNFVKPQKGDEAGPNRVEGGVASKVFQFEIGGKTLFLKSIPKYRTYDKIMENYEKHEEAEDRYTVAEQMKCIGTSDLDPAMRNRAARMCQDFLIGNGATFLEDHQNIIADVFFALTRDEHLMIASELAKGEKFEAKFRRYEMTPEFIQSELWLQIMDCICGQLDRHRGNVRFVLENNKLTSISAFDNDLSLPTVWRGLDSESEKYDRMDNFIAIGVPDTIVDRRFDIDSIMSASVDGISTRNYAMPPIIYKSMVEVFEKVDPEKFALQLKNELGCPDCVLEPLKTRIIEVKKRVKEMADTDKCRDSWTKRDAKKAGCNETNFYGFYHLGIKSEKKK